MIPYLYHFLPGNIGVELEDSLGDITEVTGHVKIVRSYALLSLHFLKSLRVIQTNSAVDTEQYVILLFHIVYVRVCISGCAFMYSGVYWGWDLVKWLERRASIPMITSSNPSSGSEFTLRSDLLLTARGGST
jgi:hypothetical protein